jgi:hypothetical protein
MDSTDLYIVAAGNGSRLRVGVPKALVPILDEPCLTTTLQLVAHRFRRVFVITNVLMRDAWSAYLRELGSAYPELSRRIVNVPIPSGLGDGHATLHGLLGAERAERAPVSQEVVIMWGDVFLPSGELFDELLSRPCPGAGLVPAIAEQNPYVCLRVNEHMQCVAADFSKYGELHATGLHDQSVFRFERPQLLDCLLELHRCLWKGDRYITPGGELSLLYSFHKLYNTGSAVNVYETAHATLSFNTAEEIQRIQRELGVSRAALIGG